MFNSCQLLFILRYSVVASRIELDATWLSAEFGRPALDYRKKMNCGEASQIALVGLEPTPHAPKARLPPLHLSAK